MNESRNDMAVFKVEVIMGSKDVGRDYTSEGTAMLFMICSVGGCNELL